MAKEENPFLKRYPPCCAITQTGFAKQVIVNPKITVFGDSVTDKESYRLSLVGKRGSIGTGSNNTGWYMFEDGKYDHDKDFSYFYRKDLSIVEIDNYIKEKTKELESADVSLKASIEAQIAKAQQVKAEMKTKKDDTSTGDTAE